ncbi:MAG: hypothetical protein RL846_25245 [Deltaproteobacteria bacterium]
MQKLWLGLSLVALVGCATPRHERRVAIQPLEARARDLMDDDRLHVAMRLLMSQVGRSKPGPARTRAEVLLVEVGRRIDDRLVLPVWLEANIGARLWKLPLSAEQRTWAHYALGSHDARKGDSEAAIAHLEEVPASSEHYPRAQFRMGLIAAGHRRDAIAGRKLTSRVNHKLTVGLRLLVYVVNVSVQGELQMLADYPTGGGAVSTITTKLGLDF